MSIKRYLPELLEAGVISNQTASDIQDFYKNKKQSPDNRLFIVFGILGATLVGLGIILILAHNWDNFPRIVKTTFAFLPLILAQVICGYVLLKKSDSVAWRESSATFLFFTVGASIALIGQIYNIPGNLSSYILTWMLLCFPLIYVMRSSIVSMLYLGGITYYACETGYWAYPEKTPYLYWLLLALAVPHYYLLFKNNPKSNFTTLHNWLVPLSLIIILGTMADQNGILMFIGYFCLFGLLYQVGIEPFFKSQKLRNNGYQVLGSIGTMILLLALTFSEFWEELRGEEWDINSIFKSPEIYTILILFLLAGAFFIRNRLSNKLADIEPVEPIFIVFIILFLLGMVTPFTVVLANILVFVIGILIVRKGANENHLGILNYGLLVLTLLLICRFFDTELSFVIRGILFVVIGVGFFIANYLMLQKRKSNEQ